MQLTFDSHSSHSCWLRTYKTNRQHIPWRPCEKFKINASIFRNIIIIVDVWISPISVRPEENTCDDRFVRAQQSCLLLSFDARFDTESHHSGVSQSAILGRILVADRTWQMRSKCDWHSAPLRRVMILRYFAGNRASITLGQLHRIANFYFDSFWFCNRQCHSFSMCLCICASCTGRYAGRAAMRAKWTKQNFTSFSWLFRLGCISVAGQTAIRGIRFWSLCLWH